MIKFLEKLFPCKHPLDKVKLVSTTKTKASSIHYDHKLEYLCAHCSATIVKEFETMTHEFDSHMKEHIGDIEASMFFGLKD